MNPYVILIALLAACAAHGEEPTVIRLSEPVAATDSYEDFGARLDDRLKPMSLGAVMAQAASMEDKTILISTRVSRVCQKKGCFFIAQDGDYLIRVAFRDYGFFVPTDLSGKTVTLSGKLVKREVSAEEAEHFREDAPGADLPAGTVYEIIADAVRVPRAPADS